MFGVGARAQSPACCEEIGFFVPSSPRSQFFSAEPHRASSVYTASWGGELKYCFPSDRPAISAASPPYCPLQLGGLLQRKGVATGEDIPPSSFRLPIFVWDNRTLTLPAAPFLMTSLLLPFHLPCFSLPRSARRVTSTPDPFRGSYEIQGALNREGGGGDKERE